MPETALATLTPLGVKRQRTVRKILGEFLAQELATEHDVHTNEIVARALARFAQDDEFASAAVREVIHQMVPKLLGETFHARRDRWLVTAAGAISRQRLEDTVRDRFSKVFENANGKYTALLDMTRPDLLAAADARQRRVDGESRWIAFERETAALLPDDEKKVGDVLDDKMLADLVEKHFAHAE